MLRDWLLGVRKYCVGAGAALAFATGATAFAGDNDAVELRQLIEQQRQLIEDQNRKLEELKQKVDAGVGQAVTALADQGAASTPSTDTKAVQKIVADYLQDHPGANLPAGVQIGYNGNGNGFSIKSSPAPAYTNWQDESKIPFELRIRGRIQLDEYYYNAQDNLNHLNQQLTYPSGKTPASGGTNPTGIRGANSTGDFNQLEVKRMRLIFEGTAFDPNLRYHIQFDGGTRGLTAASGGSGETGIANDGTSRGGGQPGTADGNGIGIVDHSVRLLGCYVAYDWHPTGSSLDCPDGSYRYSPTITGIAGKFKPLFGAEEVGGSANCQFVEFGPAQWTFDTDDDNYLTQLGVQVRALQDRFFFQAALTNAGESQTSALQDQRIPGSVGGMWYDFGGTWNEARKAWDLYGDGVADINYSCKPVFRVGADYAILPGDRRTQYTNIDLGRIKIATNSGPGSTSLIGELNGGGNNGFAVDAFDTYEAEAYFAGKYRGIGFLSDFFVRDIDNFRGEKQWGGSSAPILYSYGHPGSGATPQLGVFMKGSLVDYGFQNQIGYFLIPKKLEVCARWSLVRGESGSPYGNGNVIGHLRVQTAPAVTGTGAKPATFATANILQDAFATYSNANEYTVGVNYYFHGAACKWQTDCGYFTGGWGGGNGQSPAGYIPGVDGFLARTQLTFAF